MTGFAGNTRVLLPNGRYKNIMHLKPGDYILNMDYQPVQVKDITCKKDTAVVRVDYPQWYIPLYCSPNNEVMMRDPSPKKEDDDTRWTMVQNGPVLIGNFTYQKKLPTSFSIPLVTSERIQSLTPTYRLGLLFGLYSGYGTIVGKTVEFCFGPNDALVELVAKILQEDLRAESKITKEDQYFKVSSDSEHLLELFLEFKDKLHRVLPVKFWSSDKDYIQGLFEGLVEFDPESSISKFITASKDMPEVFLWICSILNFTFDSEQFFSENGKLEIYMLTVTHNKEPEQFVSAVVSPYKETVDLWEIKVDGSFIVNNLIVRGD